MPELKIWSQISWKSDISKSHWFLVTYYKLR